MSIISPLRSWHWSIWKSRVYKNFHHEYLDYFTEKFSTIKIKEPQHQQWRSLYQPSFVFNWRSNQNGIISISLKSFHTEIYSVHHHSESSKYIPGLVQPHAPLILPQQQAMLPPSSKTAVVFVQQAQISLAYYDTFLLPKTIIRMMRTNGLPPQAYNLTQGQ